MIAVKHEHSQPQSTFGQTNQNDWAVLQVLSCMVHLTVYFDHVTYAFGVTLHTVIAWISQNSLLKTGTIYVTWVTVIGLEPGTIYS